MRDKEQLLAQDVYNAVQRLNELMIVVGKAGLRVDLDVMCIGTMEDPDLKILTASIYLRMKGRSG